MTRPETGPLTSRSGRVKQARRLTSRTVRAERREFLVEGPQAVREALRTSETTLEVFATAAATLRHPDLVAAARVQRVEWHTVTDDVVAVLADTVTPQGVVARCRFSDASLVTLLGGSPRLLAVLVGVRDPGNAGTVIRCADAAGADGVVLADNSVDAYNPKTVRASAGSLFHLPVVACTQVAQLLAAVRGAGLRVLAADAAGARSLDEASDATELAGPTAWLFGNEARGLPPAATALADAGVRVPIHGRAESLNLATAAAVCLYASARAQRRPGGCRAAVPEQ